MINLYELLDFLFKFLRLVVFHKILPFILEICIILTIDGFEINFDRFFLCVRFSLRTLILNVINHLLSVRKLRFL